MEFMIFDVWIPLMKKGVRKEHIEEWTVSTSMVVFFLLHCEGPQNSKIFQILGEKKGMHHTDGQEP